MNERMVVGKGGVITYKYDIDGMPDIGFEFTLLSEVGESYQRRFRELMAERRWTVERGRDIDTTPWCADILMRRG